MFAQDSHRERNLATVLEGVHPAPRWQVWVTAEIRVDALFDDCRLVLEYDGRDHHTRERDRRRDHLRQQQLEALGYTVMRIRAEDLRDPQALRARILERLAELRLRPRG